MAATTDAKKKAGTNTAVASDAGLGAGASAAAAAFCTAANAIRATSINAVNIFISIALTSPGTPPRRPLSVGNMGEESERSEERNLQETGSRVVSLMGFIYKQ